MQAIKTIIVDNIVAEIKLTIYQESPQSYLVFTATKLEGEDWVEDPMPIHYDNYDSIVEDYIVEIPKEKFYD